MKLKNHSNITQKIITWYALHRRQLPWRDSINPYTVWVSEIMLQQTQVKTVIPYYTRFIKKYPTVQLLAKADRDELMKCWEGLGYYRRVINMHGTAKKIVAEHGGRFPESRQELKAHKGIGEYVSAIVASISFGENCAAVDGNVLRVISRLFMITKDISKTSTKKHIADICQQLLPAGKAGDFNQALMDLGAMICRKQNPTCNQCPVSGHCKAFQLNRLTEVPFKPKKKTVPHYTISAGAVIKNGKVLIGLRKPDALLGNLWEFPGGKCLPNETPENCCIREIMEETGLTVSITEKMCVLKHAYTHFKITLHAFLCEYIRGNPAPISAVELKYVNLSELSTYAFPKANHKILNILYALRENNKI